MDDCFDADPRVAHIRVAAVDGSGEVALADYASAYAFTQPWSPNVQDGMRQLVYTGGEVGDVFRVNADGTDPVDLTNDGLNQLEAQWSPRGDLIAFVTQALPEVSKHPHGRLEVVAPDGTGRRVLFKGKYAVGEPLWSPNGKMILFTSYTRLGYPTALVVHVETGEFEIIRSGHDAVGAAWSPNSRTILFGGNVGDVLEYPLPDGPFVNLTHGPGFDAGPDWQALPRSVA